MHQNSMSKPLRLVVGRCALFVCDMQERFRPRIASFEAIAQNTRRLLEICHILKVPVIATEQYPVRLGATVAELEIQSFLDGHLAKPVEKTQFSMCVNGVMQTLEKISHGDHGPVESVIIAGIETHACIRQTVFDLLHEGKEVHIVADCCSSRNQTDRVVALRQMSQIPGVNLTTVESVALELLRDASNENFKDIQKFITPESANTNLLGNL